VALSARAGVVDIEDQTLAQIGANAEVQPGRNVSVLASGETKVVNVVGQAAVGIGAAGIGASAAVTRVDKDTEANIGAVRWLTHRRMARTRLSCRPAAASAAARFIRPKHQGRGF
jgi:hypothetical protein